MAKTKLKLEVSLIAAVIISAMHTGYRRANIAFDKGENAVEIDESQLAIIEQDSNLLVQSAEPLEPTTHNQTQGNMDNNHVGDGINVGAIGHVSASLDDVALDLSSAPEALTAIIAEIHLKNSQEPLTSKPSCKDFGELKVSANDRDAAWAWYQENVINHIPDSKKG